MTDTLFPNGRWLLCPPQFFDVTYEINPWMSIANSPEKQSAGLQWRELHHTLLRLGAYVEYVEPCEGNPDLVFTANAGLVKGNNVVLSKFKHPERQGEEPIFRTWFENNDYKVHELTKGSFEGEGDALFCGDTLYMGYGFRTDKSVAKEVGAALNVKNVIPLELVDGRFYHLDTCFCPLGPALAMVHKEAFSEESFALLEKELDLIVVPYDEALKFVCNAVVLGHDIVLPKDCPQTYKQLEEKGFFSYGVELHEFLKGGGSAKCLTLYLDRA